MKHITVIWRDHELEVEYKMSEFGYFEEWSFVDKAFHELFYSVPDCQTISGLDSIVEKTIYREEAKR